jgi:ubiquinone/menaquinone biosynthesis C-methylase UbiE
MTDANSKKSIYTNGEYFIKHPTWHSQDSPWKARHILYIMKRNSISPRTICEVGCGVGEILRQLQSSMSPECEFDGFEISPQAHSQCLKKANNKLRFHLGDFFKTKTHFDLILLIDLIEHLEDYYGFLKKIRPRSDYKILHIPLELCVHSMLKPITLQIRYDNAGHLHHFTKETALRSLEHCGYKIVDWFYTHTFIDLRKRGLAPLIKPVIKAVTRVNEEMASRLFFGNSLMILAR